MEACSGCGGVGDACICNPEVLMSFLRDFRQSSAPLPTGESTKTDSVTYGQGQTSDGILETAPAEQSELLEQPPGRSGEDAHCEDSPQVYEPLSEYPWLRPEPWAGATLKPVERRRLPGRAVAAVLTALAVIGAAGIIFIMPSRSSLEGLTGSQIMHRSLAAALKAGAAHATVATSVGDQTITGSTDFSPAGGIERAARGPQSMTIIYIGGKLYMQADPAFLAQTLNLSNASASQYGDRWISLPSDNPDLQQMARALKTSVVVSDLLTLAGPITKVRSGSAGEIALRGRLAANPYNDGSGAGDLATMMISARSPFYPLSISYSDPQNGTTKFTFSRWGEHLDLKTPPNAVPASALSVGSTPLPATAPNESTAPAPSITDTSDQPGVAVTAAEAQNVGTELWQAWIQARATRDITALETLDAQPELSADWGYICQYTCAGPWLTLSSIAVTVPKQTKWPADFLATATYTTDCNASASPCDNTFVAVQTAPGAPWKIASMTNWSGNSYATTSPAEPGQLSAAPTPPPGSHVTTLPQEYAEYLQAIKTTGKPPAHTRLGPGPFTTSLVSANYYPESEQQADGLTDNITYYTNKADPIWQFPGTNGATAVCGSVRYTDTEKATTTPLSQSPADHPFGNLATGTYSSVTMTGIHLVCFEVYSDPNQPVAVFGTWGDAVTASGTAIQAQTNPN